MLNSLCISQLPDVVHRSTKPKLTSCNLESPPFLIVSVGICGSFIDKVQWITRFFCDAELLLRHNARQIFSDLHKTVQ